MEILAKAACACEGIPAERSDNDETARMCEGILQEQNARVPQLPRMRKTFGVPAQAGKIDSEREKPADSLFPSTQPLP